MAYITPYSQRELPPKAIICLLLFGALTTLAYAIIAQKFILAGAIICLPLVGMALFYGIQNPNFVYLLYTTYAFFFTEVSRYLHQDKLSVGLEILLIYLFISLLIASYQKNSGFKLSNAINVLTVSYIVWIVFVLLQLLNPEIKSQGITVALRIWILRVFILYITASIVFSTPKILTNGLILVGIFTIIAFLKMLSQKFIGFDSAEKYWLYVEGGASTHILNTGIRYFSYFTDAANFGTIMGGVTLSYAIISFNTKGYIKSIFYFSIAIMAVIGLFMSGTRGALVIPLAGLILYCLICKSFKIFSISIIFGLLLFAFFSFTTIGNGNQFIRRARSAFKPAEDASYNVRIRNREEIARYLKDYPFGIGIDGVIPKLWKQGDTYVEVALPPDSHFVNIWIQTGIIGLILYIAIFTVTILRCCYIVMFCVKDNKLRQILAALTCSAFGILVSGYVGNSPDLPPTDFLIVAMIAFVMNGSYIEKQITQQNQLENKK